MVNPYLAPSLVRLRSEVNERWPGRDKASDGWLGDPAHRRRLSEHNPDSRGCVHAIDIDASDIDPPIVIEAVRGHESAWYTIHDRWIWSRFNQWRPMRYTGANPHLTHLHVSIMLTRGAENNTTPWLEEDMPTADEIANAVFKKLISTNITDATKERDPQARSATLAELAIVATRHGYSIEGKIEKLTDAIEKLTAVIQR